MKAISCGPSEVEEMLKLNSDLYNIPCVGADNNVVFTAYQANFAPVRLHNSGLSHIYIYSSPFFNADYSRSDFGRRDGPVWRCPH